MNETIHDVLDFKPRGEVTVELFDGDGNRTAVQKSTNFIAPAMTHIYRAMMTAVFTRYKANAATVANPVGDLFNRLVLTTATHEPAPTSEWLLKGAVIGYTYTDSTYAGSNTLRGNYNTVESGITGNTLRVVADFPTSAGNGTIGSVYFMPSIGRGGTTGNAQAPLTISSTVGFERPVVQDRAILKSQFYNNKYYVLLSQHISSDNRAGGGSRVAVYSADMVFEQFLDLKRASDSALVNAVDFWIKDDVFYYLTSSTVESAPLSTMITPQTRLLSRLADGIAHFNNRWYITRAIYSSATMWEYDNAFNLIRTITLDSPFRYSTDDRGQPMEYSENVRLYVYDGQLFDMLHVYDIDEVGVRRTERGGSNPVVGMVGDRMLITQGYLMPRLGIASRFKLPTPVTKTSTNTMKVTYDFTFPGIYE